MGLNERQTDVLRWIADGCPDRDWPDWTHRSTAKALQSRGLVRVRGHGVGWSATVTDAGRRVLDGDEAVSARRAKQGRSHTGAPGAEPRVVRRREGPRAAAPVRIDGMALVAELGRTPGSVFRVANPDDATRAGYRRAIAAITPEMLPEGKRVSYSGRDQGDLVIRLVEAPEPVDLGPAVVVPDHLDIDRPLVKWLAANPHALDVAPDSLERALRIIQGLADTLTARGHAVSRPQQPARDDEPRSSRSSSTRPARTPGGPAAFEVTVGDQTLAIELFEERSKTHSVPPEVAANLKYEWQRASAVESWEFDGRLALRIHGHSPGVGCRRTRRYRQARPQRQRQLLQVPPVA